MALVSVVWLRRVSSKRGTGTPAPAASKRRMSACCTQLKTMLARFGATIDSMHAERRRPVSHTRRGS